MKEIFENVNTDNRDTRYIIKGSIIAIIITLILLIAFSAFLAYTSISEKSIMPAIIIISAISILIGSILTTRKLKKNGMIKGFCVSAIYIISLYLISSIVNMDFSLNVHSIIMIGLVISAGMLGGIVGINFK